MDRIAEDDLINRIHADIHKLANNYIGEGLHAGHVVTALLLAGTKTLACQYDERADFEAMLFQNLKGMASEEIKEIAWQSAAPLRMKQPENEAHVH